MKPIPLSVPVLREQQITNKECNDSIPTGKLTYGIGLNVVNQTTL